MCQLRPTPRGGGGRQGGGGGGGGGGEGAILCGQVTDRMALTLGELAASYCPSLL